MGNFQGQSEGNFNQGQSQVQGQCNFNPATQVLPPPPSQVISPL